MNAFSAVGQLHKGWVGFLQRRVLSCLGCVWFDRSEAKDRVLAGKRYFENSFWANQNRVFLESKSIFPTQIVIECWYFPRERVLIMSIVYSLSEGYGFVEVCKSVIYVSRRSIWVRRFAQLLLNTSIYFLQFFFRFSNFSFFLLFRVFYFFECTLLVLYLSMRTGTPGKGRFRRIYSTLWPVGL